LVTFRNAFRRPVEATVNSSVKTLMLKGLQEKSMADDMHQNSGRSSTRYGNTMKSAHRRQQGFSLLEVTVVLGVTMIGLAMAIVQTSGLVPNLKANSAMDQVSSQLREARDTAMTQRRQVELQFAGNNQITVTVLEPIGTSLATTVTLDGGAQFMLFGGMPDTPMAFGNNAAIYFGGVSGGPTGMQFMSTGGLVDANGNPISGTVFLGIPGQPATARAVSVLGATGRIREYHWNGNAWQE
jgi:type II secretory pathway pseudopilin PulG